MSQQDSSPGTTGGDAPPPPAAQRYAGPADGAPPSSGAASLASSTCTRYFFIMPSAILVVSPLVRDARVLSLSLSLAHEESAGYGKEERKARLGLRSNKYQGFKIKLIE